jgi:hypothetical protein
MNTSLTLLIALLFGMTAFPAHSTDWDQYRFGYKFLTCDSSYSTRPEPYVVLTAENFKKITDCRQGSGSLPLVEPRGD